MRRVLESVSIQLAWVQDGRGVTYVGTGLRLRDLRQVNPVVPLLVTQSIFVSVRLAVPTPSLAQLLELIDRMRPVYFHIDTDPAVQIALRKHNVQIGNFTLDDRSLGFARLLIRRNPHRCRLVPQQLVESRVQLLSQVVGNLVEPVRLLEVNVVDGYSRFRQVPVLGVLRAGLGNQKIEKLVVTLVLRLVDHDVSTRGRIAPSFSILQGIAHLRHAANKTGVVAVCKDSL